MNRVRLRGSVLRGCRWGTRGLCVALSLLAMAASFIAAPAGESRIPPVTVLDAAGGRHSLHNLLAEGTTLLLFWNTPCVSCLDKLREIVAFADSRSEPDFRLLMINTDPPRNAKQVKPFLHRYGFDPAHNFMDADAEVFRKLQGGKQPLLLLLDSSGAILFRSDAYSKNDLDSLDRIIGGRVTAAAPAEGEAR
jgi:hypothetical protein